MSRRIQFFVIVGLLLSCGNVMAGNTSQETAAISAAQNWLATVDTGRYVESWKQTANYLRNTINQLQWEQSMKKVRQPLGKLKSRNVQTITHKTSPHEVLIVVKFGSSFEKKRGAIETVVTMMGKNGQWQVSGYNIK